MNNTATNTKGALCGTQVIGNIVSLWYQSPTGDSSDSQIHELVCLSNEQAQLVAQMHREVWGLDK
jgi:hypothetical protein